MVDHPPVKSGHGEDFFLLVLLVFLLVLLLLLIAVVRNFTELAGFRELFRP